MFSAKSGATTFSITTPNIMILSRMDLIVYNNDYSSIINNTSTKHYLPLLKRLALVLNSLDTLSDVRIKVFTLLF